MHSVWDAIEQLCKASESLHFIQGLMRELAHRAKEQSHKAIGLLVICTAWEHLWEQTKAESLSPLADSQPASFSELLRALVREAESKTLRVPVISELPIGKLYEPLEASVAIEFPGLTEMQCKLIAGRASGTPGVLFELILKLKTRDRHLFEKNDPARKMTQKGEAVRLRAELTHSV